MEDWAGTFESYLNSGVYTGGRGREAGIIAEAALARGLDFFRIDLKKVVDKAGSLKEIANALEFPSYFGMNWDALVDCLTDMAWRPAAGYVLFFINGGHFAARAPDDMKTVLTIFGSAVEYWKEREVPFFVIFAQK
jgi:RNAse (barnase) inhibitor barstar